MVTALVGLTLFLIGICVGIRAEYRNGYLDRRLHEPWPKPKPVILHEAFIDDCEEFNRAMISTPIARKVFEAPETIH